MSEIVAVLAVSDGSLLHEGPCGAKPPVVSVDPDVGWGNWWGGHPRALPLWWNGALVPEGWDRAVRVFEAWVKGEIPNLPRSPALDNCDFMAAALVRADLASRVVRLARVDGRLVEVAP